MPNKKITAMIALVLLLSILTLAAGAATLVDTDEPTSLTLRYGYDSQPFPDLTVRVYRVATISDNIEFTLTGAFADLPVAVNSVKTQEEWNQIASTLSALIVAEGITADAEVLTDENGSAVFPELAQGLYLVEGIRAERDDGYCQFDSFMITLPDLDENDMWVYDVVAKPKSVFHEIVSKEITYTVTKLWKDVGYEHERPQNVTIDLYKDGTLVETVTLSSENDWTYSWTTVDDGAVWHAVEADVPDGYTVTLDQNEGHFTVINTYDIPDKPPQTGDNSGIEIILVVMIIAGLGIILLGILAFKRKKS